MGTSEIPGRVRASDGEREQYARVVREATGEGRLTLEEGDERLQQIYAARFRDELRPLVADLPSAAEPSTALTGWGHRPSGWGPAGWGRGPMGRRSQPHPGAFAFHLGTVVVVSALLIGLWAATGATFFWPAIPLIFFAMGLVRHARWAGYRNRGRQ